MNVSQLSGLPWQEVKQKALAILDFNASNDKITYQDFKDRDNDYKQTILTLFHILGYQDIHNTKEYYEKIRNTFKEINTLVNTYNQTKNTELEKVKIYEAACLLYFKEQWNSCIYDEIEQKNIIAWYKSYRGMAKLKVYGWNLSHIILQERTIQHMRQETAKTYIINPKTENDRKTGIERYSQQLEKNIQDEK